MAAERADHATRVLIADADPLVARGLADLLARDGHDTVTARDGVEAWDLLQAAAPPFHLLICDMELPGIDGRRLLTRIRDARLDVVPIVITGFGKIEAAVAAVKLGASDYLTKPLVDDELRLAVEKAAQQQALLAENHVLKNQLAQRDGLDRLVGTHHRMQKVYDLVEAVAASDTTVLISGESGTGKSVVGRAIHALSARGADRRRADQPARARHKLQQPDRRDPKHSVGYPGGPFVTFACGSIPEALLESELFGHVRGAFTGAESDKPGKLAAAEGGTLFIDEINSATSALQLKLLRVLQEKVYEPLGSTRTRRADVRFVLATNQDLGPLVADGSFREDLYYRIHVVNIPVPALRDRPGDVPLLAEHFLNKHNRRAGRDRRLSEPASTVLQRYGWPGNVRELENAIERAVVLSTGPMIQPADLPEAVQRPGESHPLHGGPIGGAAGHIPALVGGWHPTPLSEALREPERQIVQAALEANGWNRQETARQLEINRTTLYKKIKQFALDRPA